MDDLPSDAEENLELIAESEEAVAALSASGAKKRTRASPAEPTSEAQVLQRVNQKCRCKDENNCFLKVSSATLLKIKMKVRQCHQYIGRYLSLEN